MPEEPSNRPSAKKPAPPPMRFGRGLMGWVVFAVLTVVLMTTLLGRYQQREEMTPADLWNHARNNEVKTLLLKTDRVEGELKPNVAGPRQTGKFYVVVNFQADHTFGERLQKVLEGKDTHFTHAPAPGWIEQVLPNVVFFGGLVLLLWFLVFRRIGQAGAGTGFLGNFGRSRHRVTTKEHTNVTFNDVAGIEEAKEEVREIIEFLKNPRKFSRIGARIPRGVLLVGEPGCGKTLLAKAIAGEAEVPFLSISGSDFVEMFVGVGASRVRDLFRQAKESAPCIIFLDEIDAVGRRRGVGFNGGGHDEREQTLNAILVEIDGFDTNDQVIVIAATNRMDVLDPALTRPGRFDRQIHVPLPDIKGRFDILKIYASKVNLAPDADLYRLARGTPMFSGADLAALINEAAIAAAMVGKDCVAQADLEEARDKVRWGRARKSHVIDEREKEMTTYHEAGHAVVQVLTPNADPLHKVSIIPRGLMAGGTFSLPETDRYMYTRAWCEAFIRIAVGGRIAEEMFCGDVDSGAAADIAQATDVARKMVTEWGMSEQLSFVRYAPSPQRSPLLELAGKEYSEKTAEIIDAEIKGIMEAACRDARGLLETHRDTVQRVAQALLKYETLDVEDIRRILSGQTLDKPSVGDLLERERARTPAGAKQTGVGQEPAPGPGPLPQPG